MNAIEPNVFHRSWEALGRRLPRPVAVLCISAHWETRGVAVTAAEHPETLHDFGGFPQALFDVQYPAPGDVALARRTAALLAGVRPSGDARDGARSDSHSDSRGGIVVRLDPDRGLDHGAWSVLAAMYPPADVPVVQLSLDTREPGAFHADLGRALAPLRDEGVLILASGNIVHNLRVFDFHDPAPTPWAVRCDEDFRRRIAARDHAALIAFETLGHDAHLAIPTPEHYLPLLYAIALQRPDESAQFFNSEVQSSISMTSLLIGAA